MKYFKELTEETTYDTWNAQIGFADTKTQIMDFFNELQNVKLTDKIHWVSAGRMKHLIEDYSSNINNSGYICRDQTVAMAIVYGFPVDLHSNPKDNMIGIYMPKRRWNNLVDNVGNNKAIDLDFAQANSYEKYHLNLHKQNND